jgi:hypothetical protein
VRDVSDRLMYWVSIVEYSQSRLGLVNTLLPNYDLGILMCVDDVAEFSCMTATGM